MFRFLDTWWYTFCRKGSEFSIIQRSSKKKHQVSSSEGFQQLTICHETIDHLFWLWFLFDSSAGFGMLKSLKFYVWTIMNNVLVTIIKVDSMVCTLCRLMKLVHITMHSQDRGFVRAWLTSDACGSQRIELSCDIIVNQLLKIESSELLLKINDCIFVNSHQLHALWRNAINLSEFPTHKGILLTPIQHE